jgi:Thiolase, C-terminal domain
LKRARATLYQSHLRDSHAKKKSSDITTGFHLFSHSVVSAARFQPNASSSSRCRRDCASRTFAKLATLYDERRFSSDAGAGGARVLVTLIYEMIRRDVHLDFAALCLGGANAVAMAVER